MIYVDFKVDETGNVKNLSEEAAVLQGESNRTTFYFMLPPYIRGYNGLNYTQEIVFKSEKGQVLRFNMNNSEFALNREITAFKSVLVQLVLTNTEDEDEPIVWRSIPFKYDFIKSINAIKPKGE